MKVGGALCSPDLMLPGSIEPAFTKARLFLLAGRRAQRPASEPVPIRKSEERKSGVWVMSIAETHPHATASSSNLERTSFLGAPFDPLTFETVVHLLRASGSGVAFRYVVTPNVDHVVRLNKDRSLARYYDKAWLSLCDSRPISMLGRLLSVHLPLVTGSDLTATLFKSVIQNGDVVSVVAPNQALARTLERAYPDIRFRFFVPPPGVQTNEQAARDCVEFVAGHEARFVFICIGSPQSEKIASALALRVDASGTAFCVGAALEFLVGSKKRAPLWMRRAGLEWLHRLSSDPLRLWQRYASSVVPLLLLFTGEVVGRPKRPG
jgi:N-acetylglucosaminyldiphosphoundecaprenol N-acetyl-beta-D-mannosaminyltransferase